MRTEFIMRIIRTSFLGGTVGFAALIILVIVLVILLVRSCKKKIPVSIPGNGNSIVVFNKFLLLHACEFYLGIPDTYIYIGDLNMSTLAMSLTTSAEYETIPPLLPPRDEAETEVPIFFSSLAIVC